MLAGKQSPVNKPWSQCYGTGQTINF